MIAVSEASKDEVKKMLRRFTMGRRAILIISYETFRIHEKLFKHGNECGLLICDEAHRLKNKETKTAQALNNLATRRRVLLSGTPIQVTRRHTAATTTTSPPPPPPHLLSVQNHLDEFYSMVDFCNPGLLGSEGEFNKNYARAILRGREPDASDKHRAAGDAKGKELGELCNSFILRRTNTLLSKHLPPKVVLVVCCSMSDLQLEMCRRLLASKLRVTATPALTTPALTTPFPCRYRRFLASKQAKQALNGGKQTMVLASIGSLRKLCNHPLLVMDKGTPDRGFESCVDLPGLDADGPEPAPTISPGGGRGRSGALGMAQFKSRGPPPVAPHLSGKFHVLYKMLLLLKKTTDDRIVLVSNYTTTLDLFERLCQQQGWKCCKLDGSCSIKKRTKMVEEFNDPRSGLFCFLLSSKAGGCGLNLIGGNRLVLFDPDWNPANDKQAAARVWRDGQKKRVYIYRMLAAGSIEEKVFERQLSKEGLSGIATNDEVRWDAPRT